MIVWIPLTIDAIIVMPVMAAVAAIQAIIVVFPVRKESPALLGRKAKPDLPAPKAFLVLPVHKDPLACLALQGLKV